LLHGDIEVVLEGHKTMLKPGDVFHVKQNQWHKFHTLDGAIFEEVSTTHYNDDSFYEDVAIVALSREERKTKVANWKVAVKK
jgi:N-acetylneuraminate synthase